MFTHVCLRPHFGIIDLQPRNLNSSLKFDMYDSVEGRVNRLSMNVTC